MPTTPFQPEHQALRDTARRLVDGPLDTLATQAEAGGLPHAEALRLCAEVGAFELDDVLAEIVIAEELGRLRSGGLVAVLLDAMLTSEVGVASTAVARSSTLELDGEHATGELPFVPGAQVADRCLVADNGIVFELSAAVVTPVARSHSWRGAGAAGIVVDRIPVERVDLGPLVQRAELREAAATVGGAWRTWQGARTYAQQREAFGRPISRFQVNRHALAVAATKITAAEALVHDTAWQWSNGDAVDPAAARLYAATVAVDVADLAVQLHGGYGYTTEFDPQRAWRDAHALRLGDDGRRRRVRTGAST